MKLLRQAMMAGLRYWDPAIALVALCVAVEIGRAFGSNPGAALIGSVAAVFILAAQRRREGQSLSRAVVWQLGRQLTAAIVVGSVFLFLDTPIRTLLFVPFWLALTALAMTGEWLWVRFIKYGMLLPRPLRRLLTVIADPSVVGAALTLGASGWSRQLRPEMPVPRSFQIGLALLWLIFDRLPWFSWRQGACRVDCVGRFLVRLSAWVLIVVFCLHGMTAMPFSTAFGAGMLPALFLSVFAAWTLTASPNQRDVLGFLVVTAFAYWLMAPLASTLPLGAGDAVWYGSTVADVILQFRRGVFPVLVGQSIYQFNGSVFPIRVAPLYHHLVLLVDTLMGRSLGFAATQNLTLMLLGLAGGLSAFFSLGRLLPSRRLLAAALAILYLASPGVAGVLYNADLYMTWTTVPVLPLALLAALETFETKFDFRSLILLAVALALLWWGHSPIALWSTAILGGLQLIRLSLLWKQAAAWFSCAKAGIVFLTLAAFPFVSVFLLQSGTAGDGISYAVALPGTIAMFVERAFPAALLPLAALSRTSPGDLQLGWSLWFCFGLTAVAAVRRSGIPLRYLVCSAATLLLLMLPIPRLNFLLWTIVPGVIRNPTGNWPMERLYLIAAGLVVFATAWMDKQAIDEKRAWRNGAYVWLVLFGLGWSTLEIQKFRLGSREIRIATELQPSLLRPENLALSRYAYLLFAEPPPYFSHGVVEPALEQRLFDRANGRLLTSNSEVLAHELLAPGAEVLQTGQLKGGSFGGEWRFVPAFTLEPGRKYVLDVDFAPGATGVLIVNGKTEHRLYQLPYYGGELAFGAGPQSSHLLALSTSGPVADAVTLSFVPQEEAIGRSFRLFAAYRFIEYTNAELPVKVTDWIPLTATVSSPRPAWFETPRMYQAGYVATVASAPAEVTRSPRGLVQVAVPAGQSEVVVRYQPPLALKLAYFVSAFGFLVVAMWAVIRWLRADAGPAEASQAAAIAEN